jgi:hypothetical protein
MTYAHFKRIFKEADSSVSPETLIDLLIYLNTCYSWLSPEAFINKHPAVLWNTCVQL